MAEIDRTDGLARRSMVNGQWSMVVNGQWSMSGNTLKSSGRTARPIGRELAIDH
jgi:hypothetical protein